MAYKILVPYLEQFAPHCIDKWGNFAQVSRDKSGLPDVKFAPEPPYFSNLIQAMELVKEGILDDSSWMVPLCGCKFLFLISFALPSSLRPSSIWFVGLWKRSTVMPRSF